MFSFLFVLGIHAIQKYRRAKKETEIGKNKCRKAEENASIFMISRPPKAGILSLLNFHFFQALNNEKLIIMMLGEWQCKIFAVS
jgi:hypothetical protein